MNKKKIRTILCVLLAAAGLTADVSVPAPALSFAPSWVPGPFQPGEALSVGWAGVLRRHPCGVP